MGDPNVKLRFSGDAADAERALARLERKYGDLENRIRNTSRTSKQGASQVGDGLRSVSLNVASTVAAYISIPAVIFKAVEAQRQFTQEAAATTAALAEANQLLRVQGGLSEIQGEKAQRRVLASAYKNAVPSDVANKAAVQLISSGFDTDTATGAGLNSVLETLVATNKKNEDPTQLVQAAGQFLSAQGLDKNAANLEQLLVGSQSLFQGTDFQISDLTQLASKSGGLRGQGIDQILGTFDILRSTTSPDKAATGLKIFAERLSGAKGDNLREAQLKKLGLSTGDVDLVGEDLLTVTNRVGGAIDALPEEDRAPTLQRLFGTEAASPIASLLNNRGQIQGAIDTFNDRSGFDRAVAAGTTGTAAALTRQELEGEFINLTVDREKTASLAAAAEEERQLRLRAEGTNPLAAALPSGRTLADLLPASLGLGTGSEDDFDARNFERRQQGGGIRSPELVQSMKELTSALDNNRRAALESRTRKRDIPEGKPVSVAVPVRGKFE